MMNKWLGIMVLIFILATTVGIYNKHKNMGSVVWNICLFVVVAVSFYFGLTTQKVWVVLLGSIIIGGCLILSMIHAYNKLIALSKPYGSVGEIRKPRSFGNGYWR